MYNLKGVDGRNAQKGGRMDTRKRGGYYREIKGKQLDRRKEGGGYLEDEG